MMTVITRLTLDEAIRDDWDAAMRDRMETARSVDGWVSGQILVPTGGPADRVIVGVWKSREHWSAWHDDPAFRSTRDRLDAIGADEGITVWHEALYDARA